MLEKMYRKRLKGYAAIGYSVAADQQDAALGSDIIYDQITFQARFLHDAAHGHARYGRNWLGVPRKYGGSLLPDWLD